MNDLGIDMTGQPALFGDTETPAPATPRRRGATPLWTANTTQQRCDQCYRDVAAGNIKPVMRAQWRRVCGTETARYCYPHAIPVRAADHETARRAQ